MSHFRIVIVFLVLFPFGLRLEDAAAATPVAKPGLFGSAEFVAGSPWGWLRVVWRMANERDVFASCARDREQCQSETVLDWLDTLQSLRGRRPLNQLRVVNAEANRQPYRTDAANFGRHDYYASPLEFLERSGDCEDFAIFKFFALKALGFSDAMLRIVLVERARDRAAHAVLAVYLDREIYILDNATDRVLPHQAIRGYRPLASFNATRGWMHVPK